jgi:hypothetical protein
MSGVSARTWGRGGSGMINGTLVQNDIRVPTFIKETLLTPTKCLGHIFPDISPDAASDF